MTEIVFVRHATTDLAGTFCGQLDPPLNALGREQARALAAAGVARGAGAVYASDLLRSRETASVFGFPVTLDPAWREIGFGAWEGLTWAEVEARDRAYAQRWVDEFPHCAAPGGEAFEDFRARVLRAADALRHEAPSKGRVAVITHGGVLRVVLETVCGVPPAESWKRTRDYGAAFLLTADGRAEAIA